MIEEKGIELESTKIMLQVPVNAVEINVECVVYEDGKTQKVTKNLGLSDIRSAMKDAEGNYVYPDEEYYLSDSYLDRKDDD